MNKKIVAKYENGTGQMVIVRAGCGSAVLIGISGNRLDGRYISDHPGLLQQIVVFGVDTAAGVEYLNANCYYNGWRAA